MVENNQDIDFNDNKITNIISITNNRNPRSDDKLTNKNYLDDSIRENTVLRFNQTLQNYLEVSVGNYVYNLTKYDKILIIDVTEKKFL